MEDKNAGEKWENEGKTMKRRSSLYRTQGLCAKKLCIVHCTMYRYLRECTGSFSWRFKIKIKEKLWQSCLSNRKPN